MPTIEQRIEKKLDHIETKLEKEAEKKAKRQRVIEMVRGMSFWDKLELHIKIGL
jgi:hypothetical protein